MSLPPSRCRPIRNMQAVWVSGVMGVAAAATDMGNAGYRIEAQKVAPYAEELPAR